MQYAQLPATATIPAQRASTRLRICMFLNYCAYAIQLNSVGIAVLQVQRSFGVSLVEASTLAFYKGLGILVGALIAGSFLKRIGYKRAMLIALAASTLALLAASAVANFAAVKLVFLITGVSYGLMKVSLYSTIGLISPNSREHASLMSFVETFYKIGSLITFFVFAAFTSDTDPHSTSWLHAYLLLAGLMSVAFFLLLPTPLDESSVRDDSEKPLYMPILEMARLAATPVALTLALLVFSAIVIEHGFINLLPTFNAKVMGLVPTLGIQMAALYAIFAIIGRISVGFVLRRISWFPLMATCIVGAAIVLGVGLLAAQNATIANNTSDWRQVPIAVLILPLTGLFVGPVWPVIHSATLTTLPVTKHNTLASLSVVFSSTTGAIGTPLLGWVFAQYGGRAAFAVLSIPLIILVIGIVALRRIKASSREQ